MLRRSATGGHGLAATVLALLLIVGTPFVATADAEDIRFVPQPGLTDVRPVKVAFAPHDGNLLLVVNRHGRIDLFDNSNPDRPVKIQEIEAVASDAVFSPDGRWIASGGKDGTVRLWTLAGEPAAAPFEGHTDEVLTVAFSRDGQWIASGGADGTVRLWTLDGESAAPFFGHASRVRSVAFSPDGQRIVSGDFNGTVRIWTLDGELAAEPSYGHYSPVTSVSYLPDGMQIVSGGYDRKLRLWTPDGDTAARPIDGRGAAILSLAVSRDGARIVSGDMEGSVRLWTRDGALVAEMLQRHRRAVMSVAFSPDGQRILAGWFDGTIQLLALEGQPVSPPFERQDDSVWSVDFSPDGRQIVSGGDDQAVRLWTLDGEPAATPFEGHDAGVYTVAFSPDGTRIASGSGDGSVRLSSTAGTPVGEPFLVDEDSVFGVAFSPDGRLVATGGADKMVRLWTSGGEQVAAPFEGHQGFVLRVAFSPNGKRIVSGGADGTLRLWTLEGEQVALFEGHEDRVLGVDFSPDGRLIASGSLDGTVRLWTPDGRPAAAPFRGHEDRVTSVAFSPDGAWIISGGLDGTLRLWSLKGEQVTAPILGHGGDTAGFGGGPLSVAFSPDGTKIVSGGNDGTVRLWGLSLVPAAASIEGPAGLDLDGNRVQDIAFAPGGTRMVSRGQGVVRLWTNDGESIAGFEGYGDSISSIGFSPDGQLIVSGGEDGTVRLWTLDGTPVGLPFEGHEAEVLSVAYSPDGQSIVSGDDDGMVWLWTPGGPQATEPFACHGDRVSSVVFSPEGDRIASAGSGGAVRLWTLEGKPAVEPFGGPAGSVWSVAFSPDGRRIVSGDSDGSIRLWTLDGEPVGTPFDGHRDWVGNLVFSPDGQRIVSGGKDETVRLWTRDGRNLRTLGDCRMPVWESAASTHLLSVVCSDRVLFLDWSFETRGQLFLHPDGIVAITDAGVYAPTDELHGLVRAFGEDGTMLTRRGAVSEISIEQVRQILFDQWTPWERIQNSSLAAYLAAQRLYGGLGWMKAPFWPALIWLVAVLGAVVIWIFAPARLAHWAMPVVGSPPPPPWKWLIGVLTLYGYLGRTRRPLKAWLKANRGGLHEECFAGRAPVRERERYCVLGNETVISGFAAADRRSGRLVWIDGVGGAGKSALAFRILRTACEADRRSPLPVLVDEDWTGSLPEQVARLMRPLAADRGPTAEMVVTLGAAGLICPLVDSISERGMDDAVEQVAEATAKGAFRFVVVTSRTPPPSGALWERFERVQAAPLTATRVPEYVATYAPEDRRTEIGERIAPLVEQRESLSPLFIRFAIAQALEGELTSSATLDLVLQYLEALRAGKVELSADDMVRAASIAGVEAVRGSLVPREIEHEFLRGVLVMEADDLPFMDAENKGSVDPASVIDDQVSCGLLNLNRTNRRLQFAYDPVAEYLAAYRIAVSKRRESLRELHARAKAADGSALATALREVEAQRALYVAS